MKRGHINLFQHHLSSARIFLSEESPLRGDFEDGNLLSLNVDGSIFPHVIRFQEWHCEAMKCIGPGLVGEKYHLIDIGANIGLFTRQAMIEFPSIRSASCFEPSPNNINHLELNVMGLEGAVVKAFGLHTEDSTLKFYKDKINGGNYSFNESAVAGRPHSIIEVPTRRITPELLCEGAPEVVADTRFLWKSDTQGFDEVLMCAMPLDFWERVDVVAFEGWRIPKPSYNTEIFSALLELFPFRYVQRRNRARPEEISTQAIVDYLSGDDRGWADFLLSRARLL